MKRVRINTAANDHRDAFNQGMEQLLKTRKQRKPYKDYELDAILRYERETHTEHTAAHGENRLGFLDLVRSLVPGYRMGVSTQD